MAERSTRGCLAAAVIWTFILGGISLAAKFYIMPYFDDRLAQDTGAGSRYAHTITVLADSFSGYAVLRSDRMRQLLADKGIRLLVKDDGAAYDARTEALDNKQAQMAVFTVDSFISSGVRRGRFPASIVAVLDESRGADALVAYKQGLKSVQALNSPEAKIEVPAGSPGEFLARTVVTRFSLPLLPESWMQARSGADKVYDSFLRADKTKPVAYALWEPYVSLALQEPEAQILLDSSRVSGHIVDVLVAERHFLRDKPEVVGEILRAYFTALSYYRDEADGFAALLRKDLSGDENQLAPGQLKKLADGIQWKNTLQNYAFFNVDRGSAAREILLEDAIRNVLEVLENTGAIRKDKVDDAQISTFFFAAPLEQMQRSGFRPAAEQADRAGQELQSLGDAEWDALAPVGEMNVKPVAFARGTARLNLQSQRELQKTARTLLSLPGYYLKIIGNTRDDGDAKANQELAQARAQAVFEELVKAGVPAGRLRRENGAVRLSGGSGQSVTFELVQKPF